MTTTERIKPSDLDWHISSHSDSTHGNCVEVAPAPTVWHISTRSDSTHASCVEAGPVEDGSAGVAVRHSHHPDGPLTVYTHTAWHTFLTTAKHGHYDF